MLDIPRCFSRINKCCPKDCRPRKLTLFLCQTSPVLRYLPKKAVVYDKISITLNSLKEFLTFRFYPLMVTFNYWLTTWELHCFCRYLRWVCLIFSRHLVMFVDHLLKCFLLLGGVFSCALALETDLKRSFLTDRPCLQQYNFVDQTFIFFSYKKK